MRVAVYQRHLATLGGGERYTLDWARWLAGRGHAVDVLAPRGTTLEEAADRLGHDVRGLRLLHVDEARPCEDAAERSAAYDLFVNLSHGTTAASLAPRGVLVVHFPHRGVGPGDVLAAATVRAPGAGVRASAWAYLGAGFRASPRRGHWTADMGTIVAGRWGHGAWDARLVLAAREGGARGGTRVEVRLDGQTLTRVRLPPVGARRVHVALPPVRGQASHRLDLHCPDPARDAMTGHALGVHLRAFGLRARGARPLALGAPGRNQPYLASYDRVVANSAYTATWVRRRWGRDAFVVHPVVRPIAAAPERDRSIVAVGRFFAGDHSKRQLELLRCFKALCDSGLTGWRLDLVGGSHPLSGGYAARVREEAAGYPVDVLVDAPRAQLEERVSRASLVWQASGWGEDPAEHPDRFEHFGLALAEAMGAGAVPVALGVGGVSEIVRDGVDGVLWSDSPAEPTLALIADDARRRAMSAAARERAGAFDAAAFDAAASAAMAGLL